MHQMRAVSLVGYLEVARSVGLDGPRMLRQAGIAPEALDDAEKRLPASAVIGLLAARPSSPAARASGC